MFADIAKLFSRAFVVGFFLPAFMVLCVLIVIHNLFEPFPLESLQSLLGLLESPATVAGLVAVAWLLGLFLLIINRQLIRLLEGYYFLRRTRLMNNQLEKFDELQARIQQLKPVYEAQKQARSIDVKVMDEYRALLLRWRSRFPHSREHVLPTSFGNIFRSFEVYSSKMYGLDSIPVWPRLLGVMPAEFRQIVEDRRSIVDFAVNGMYLSLLPLLEYLLFALRTHSLPWVVLALPLPFLTMIFFHRMALGAAIQYGNIFKASIDLYRLDLLKQLRVKEPENLKEERETWTKISQSFLYWYPFDLPRLQQESESRVESGKKKSKKEHSSS